MGRRPFLIGPVGSWTECSLKVPMYSGLTVCFWEPHGFIVKSTYCYYSKAYIHYQCRYNVGYVQTAYIFLFPTILKDTSELELVGFLALVFLFSAAATLSEAESFRPAVSPLESVRRLSPLSARCHMMQTL